MEPAMVHQATHNPKHACEAGKKGSFGGALKELLGGFGRSKNQGTYAPAQNAQNSAVEEMPETRGASFTVQRQPSSPLVAPALLSRKVVAVGPLSGEDLLPLPDGPHYETTASPRVLTQASAEEPELFMVARSKSSLSVMASRHASMTDCLRSPTAHSPSGSNLHRLGSSVHIGDNLPSFCSSGASRSQSQLTINPEHEQQNSSTVPSPRGGKRPGGGRMSICLFTVAQSMPSSTSLQGSPLSPVHAADRRLPNLPRRQSSCLVDLDDSSSAQQEQHLRSLKPMDQPTHGLCGARSYSISSRSPQAAPGALPSLMHPALGAASDTSETSAPQAGAALRASRYRRWSSAYTLQTDAKHSGELLAQQGPDEVSPGRTGTRTRLGRSDTSCSLGSTSNNARHARNGQGHDEHSSDILSGSPAGAERRTALLPDVGGSGVGSGAASPSANNNAPLACLTSLLADVKAEEGGDVLARLEDVNHRREAARKAFYEVPVLEAGEWKHTAKVGPRDAITSKRNSALLGVKPKVEAALRNMSVANGSAAL